MKIRRKFLLIILFIIAAGAVVVGLRWRGLISLMVNQPGGNTGMINDSGQFFIARKSEKGFQALIYSIKNRNIVNYKQVDAIDALTFSSNESWGANDAVQYNPKTGDIFYATLGASEYDGSCVNKDGTCYSRIYKININSNSPEVIFQTESQFSQWIIDPRNNTAYASIYAGDKQVIYKIFVDTGESSILATNVLNSNTGLTQMVLSRDGKYIYQASEESVDGKWTIEFLRLHKIATYDGRTDKIEIYKGEAIDYNTDISPDENKFAFWQGRNPTLSIYNFITHDLISIPISRMQYLGIRWSGDSRRVYYFAQDKMNCYDIQMRNNCLISANGKAVPTPLILIPSSRYWLYSIEPSVEIYDTLTDKVLASELDKKYWATEPATLVGWREF